MKVIVVRQPWAWLIVSGFKDIENRTWATRYRGPVLIQASASRPGRDRIEGALRLIRERRIRKRGLILPGEFELGGIVGIAHIDDCVTASTSPWFEGPIGWVLSGPRTVPFIPLKGRLGLFDAPRNVIKRLGL